MKPKILYFQTAFLGDLFLSIPSLKYLKENYPGHELHLYCRKPFADLFVKLGLVDKAFEVNKNNKKEFSHIFSEMKSNKYDYIFTPHPSFRSAWMSFNLKAKRTIGYKLNWYSYLFKKQIKRNLKLPEAARQLALVDSELNKHQSQLEKWPHRLQALAVNKTFLDLGEDKIPSWVSLNITKEVNSWQSKQSIEIEKGLVLMAPGSVWETKKWSKESFINLGLLLSKAGYKVGVMGAPNESELCAEVSSEIPGSVDVSGQNLLPTLSMMSQARLVIGNDSGSIHMAASVNVPVVSVFGPTAPELGYRPWVQPMAIVQKDLSCRPCGKHGSNQCPIGTHECMKSVSAAEVFKACMKLLAER